MCEPVTLAAIGSQIAGAATAVGGAIASGAAAAGGAIKTAGILKQAGMGLSILNGLHQHKMQGEAYEANAEAAIRGQIEEQSMLRERLGEEREKAADTKMQNSLKARKAASRAALAGYASGAIQNQGVIQQDVNRQYLNANNLVAQNLARTESQNNRQMTAAKTKAKSRINSVAKPNKTATILNAGAGAMLALA